MSPNLKQWVGHRLSSKENVSVEEERRRSRTCRGRSWKQAWRIWESLSLHSYLGSPNLSHPWQDMGSDCDLDAHEEWMSQEALIEKSLRIQSFIYAFTQLLSPLPTLLLLYSLLSKPLSTFMSLWLRAFAYTIHFFPASHMDDSSSFRSSFKCHFLKGLPALAY